MDMDKPSFLHGKKYIYLIIAVLMSEFLIVFFNWNMENLFRSDIKYYVDFVANYPVFYTTETFGRVGVLYMPHFYLYFLPFSFISETIVYIIFSAVNLIALYPIIKLSFKISTFHGWVTSILLCITLLSLAQWGNVEIPVTLVHIAVFYHVKERKEMKWYHSFILAFFSFKIVSAVFVLLILMELNTKQIIKQGLLYAAFLLMLTLPFIYLNPQLLEIEYLLWIAENGPGVITPFTMLFRTCLTLPVIFLIYKLGRWIWAILHHQNKKEIANNEN